MRISPGKNFFFHLIFYLAIVFILSLPVYASLDETKQAGEAVFPKEEYDRWLMTQNNPKFEAAVKISSTVNSYFHIMYESQLKGKLLDFGFLFDDSNITAQEDYAYERGLLWAGIVRWENYGIHLKKFDYKPKFDEINTEKGHPVTVRITPYARLFFQDKPDQVEPTSLNRYKFSIIQKNGKWLIQSVRCNSPEHSIYPRGTDFNEVAAAMPNSIKISETESTFWSRMKKSTAPRSRQIRIKIENQKKGEQKLWLADIKKNYKFSQIVNIIKFDEIYVIVESHRPTFVNNFDFFNFITGEMKRLPTIPNNVKLHKIKNPCSFLFYADGTDHINNDRKFPFIIECGCNEKGEEFYMNQLTRYFPLNKEVKIGGKTTAALKDVKITLNGIEASFGPIEGIRGDFYAGYTNIPITKTNYDIDQNQFIITLEGTQLQNSMKQKELSADNPFLKSIDLIENESGCKIIVNLKTEAKYYTGKKGWTDPSENTPYVKFSFITEQNYETYVVRNLR